MDNYMDPDINMLFLLGISLKWKWKLINRAALMESLIATAAERAWMESASYLSTLDRIQELMFKWEKKTLASLPKQTWTVLWLKLY